MIEETHFNRATLDCMTTLRRRIKQDLGITVRLADPDAVRQLLTLSQGAASEAIRALGLQLEQLTHPEPVAPPPIAPSLGQGAIAARQYRAGSVRPAEPIVPSTPATAGVRIYRGQVIRD